MKYITACELSISRAIDKAINISTTGNDSLKFLTDLSALCE